MLAPMAMMQILTIVSREANILYKAPREKPQWAQDHGLEFNEQHHRWMNPDTGKVHSHPENDSRWEPKKNFSKVSWTRPEVRIGTTVEVRPSYTDSELVGKRGTVYKSSNGPGIIYGTEGKITTEMGFAQMAGIRANNPLGAIELEHLKVIGQVEPKIIGNPDYSKIDYKSANILAQQLLSKYTEKDSHLDDNKVGDEFMVHLSQVLRGNQQANIINGKEYDAIQQVHSTGINTLSRTVNGLYLKENMNGTFAGLGVFGSGLYFAVTRPGEYNMAEGYGGGPQPRMYNGKLASDAVVMSAAEVDQRFENLVKDIETKQKLNISDDLLELVIKRDDAGYRGLVVGADAIIPDDEKNNQILLLNKRKINVDERSVNYLDERDEKHAREVEEHMRKNSINKQVDKMKLSRIQGYAMAVGITTTFKSYSRLLKNLKDKGYLIYFYNKYPEYIKEDSLYLQKAPKETPEWARKHKLVFNEDHHRWMKPSGEHATQSLPEGHKFEVGHSYVIGPKAKNKALRGHEIQILGFAEEGRRAKFEIEGKTGWTNVSYLEQTLELGDKEQHREIEPDINEKFNLSIDILSLEGLNKSREVEKMLELKIKNLSSYKNIQKSKVLQEWTEDPTDILASIDAGQPNKEAKNLGKNMNPLGEPMILYRGIGVSPEEIMGSGGIRPQKGTVLPLTNFTSTSRGPDAALYYAGSKGTLLILEASEDIPGISIDNLDVQKYFEKLGFEEEGWSETILNYGLEYEILDVDYEGRIPVIKGRVKFKG